MLEMESKYLSAPLQGIAISFGTRRSRHFKAYKGRYPASSVSIKCIKTINFIFACMDVFWARLSAILT